MSIQEQLEKVQSDLQKIEERRKEVGLQIPFEDGCVRTVTEKLGAMME